jgi:hypothetical protein
VLTGEQPDNKGGNKISVEENKAAVRDVIEGGKELEAWPYSDTQSMFRQLGLNLPV